MAVRINLEIGHEASIRNKRTQEGFTHDWEVFVRGCDGADIQCYIEKVVFYLHETFNKPKRVYKEPPFSIKESGYAGFVLPIEIYLKNKEEPKKINFSYDLTLQPSGPAIYKVQKEKHVFTNPTEDFKHKLLKGGGTIVNSTNSLDMSDVKMNLDDKNQLVNKPKLGGSDAQKKYKTKSDEEKTNFQSLFGTPIKKSSKISPDPAKGPTKDSSKLSSSSSKDRGDKEKIKNKSPIKDKDKDRDRDRVKDKESSSERKNKEKSKDRNKERDRSKEKSSSKREKSPRPRSSSPKRLLSPKRPGSPKVQSPLPKHEDKQRSSESIGKTKDDPKTEKKYKKDKYFDKYKDSGKEHKKESSKATGKEGVTTLASVQKELSPMPLKMKDKPKDLAKDATSKETESTKSKDKVEEKKEKHKHKKKDKDKREKSKDDRHKSEKSKSNNNSQSSLHNNKYDATKETEAKTMASPKPEPQPPPLLVPPPAPVPIIPSAMSKTLKQPLFSENENSNSSLSSKEETALAYGSSPAVSAANKSDSLFGSVSKDQLSKPKKDKSRKKDKKSDKEEKKRKRKLESSKQQTVTIEDDEPDSKHFKASAAAANSISVAALAVDSDGDQQMTAANASKDLDKENQENPEEYMKILRELQHKIMTLQDNAELQRVVQLIAETGRYEVSARTFDFDLCLLERSTVRRLQEFFSISSS